MVLSLGYFGDSTSCKICESDQFLYTLWPDMTNFYSDFSEYRKVRAQEDDRMAGGNQFELSSSIQRRM